MKKLLLGTLAVSAIALTGCSDTFNPSSDSEGRILPDVNLNKEVAAPAKASAAHASARSATEITVSDLSLKLTADDGSSQRSWSSIDQFDSSENFPVGGYTFEVAYGTSEDEGFDKPYYHGKTQLRIRENETTPVAVTASLGNSMVSIVYSAAVAQYFTSFEAEVLSSSGKSFAVGAGESRAVYVKPGHVEVNVDVTKQNGISGKLNAISFEAEARHHYIVTIDVNDGNVGAAGLTITFDSDMEETEVELDLSNQILTLPAPVVTASGFTPGTAIECIAGSRPAEAVRMTISAQADVQTAVLTTDSPALLAKGWPATVDFASADAATLGKLAQLGLKQYGLTGVKSKMAMLDFTDVIAGLEYSDAEAFNKSAFTLIAKDKYSKVSEPMTLEVVVDKLNVAIVDIAPLWEEETTVDVTFAYNGADPASEVTFQLMSPRGIWDNTTVNSIKPKSRASADYVANVNVPATGDVQLRIVAAGVQTEPVVIPHKLPAHILTVNENRVFAKHATLEMGTTDGSDAAASLASSAIYLSTDGVNYTEAAAGKNGASIALSDLQPGTTYYAKALLGGHFCRPITFSTETAAQIPNGNLETASTLSSGSNWEQIAFEGWGTNNPLTTSQGSDYAYCRISGTIQTDGVSGKGALIRTVGWGSGNTATGSKGTSGTCKYSDVGLLHLGSSRSDRPAGYGGNDNKVNSCSPGPLTTDDLDCGIAFASRPSALTFQYKYAPKSGSDQGQVEVWLQAAGGTHLASAIRSLSKADSFQEVKIDFSYPDNAPKAGKLYVKFISSNAEGVKRSNDNFSGPGFANLSRGTFMGSQLTVDEVNLIY